MSLVHRVTERVGNVGTGTRRAVARARLEGEHRLLQRRHRAALERLGERVVTLVGANALPDGELGPELGEVRASEMLIAAKAAEIESMTDDPGRRA